MDAVWVAMNVDNDNHCGDSMPRTAETAGGGGGGGRAHRRAG